MLDRSEKRRRLRMILSVLSGLCSMVPAVFFLLGGVIIVLAELGGISIDDPLGEAALLLGSTLAAASAICGIIAAVKEKKDNFPTEHDRTHNRWCARIFLLLAPVILWGCVYVISGFSFKALVIHNEYAPYLFAGVLLVVIACVLPDKPNDNHSESSENNIKE